MCRLSPGVLGSAALMPCIKWSNHALQTLCFSGLLSSSGLTDSRYVITALRPKHAHIRLIISCLFPRVSVSPTASLGFSDTGLSTHAGAADACVESLNSLSLSLSLSHSLSFHSVCMSLSFLLILSLPQVVPHDAYGLALTHCESLHGAEMGVGGGGGENGESY